MTKNFLRIFIVCLAVVGLKTVTAQADIITVTTTIRDFNDTHPDFEHVIASDPGYTSATLGPDGKPVYTPALTSATTTGATNYNQWYNDVPGVNQKTSYDLVLNNGLDTPGGVYNYCNSNFFPIDNSLFGNQGRSHNYHFTMELHTLFTYVPGQWYSTTADDDLLIFVNNQRVLDLGGVHPPQYGYFSLDSLGLEAGQTYSFDLFFAERHTSLSNLCFDTNAQFVPEPGTILMLVLGAASLITRSRRRN